MNNFLDFILKDTTAKRTLISTMPTKTKTNIRKFNETLDIMHDKYEEYKSSVRNYLIAKSNSLNIAQLDDSERIEEIKTRIEILGNVKFLLNPDNTYYEKMGFDNLVYQISNYYVFNFKSLNDILNGFLDKFELVGIHLTKDDFNYTCYVNEYMTSYLEVRANKSDKYEKVNEIFEKIYWVNPQIVEHIELNFRRLIKKHAKKFESYIKSIGEEVMAANNIKSYTEALTKLDAAYNDLNEAYEEDVADVLALAKNGNIDINQFLEGNKVMKAAYDYFLPEDFDRTNIEKLNKIVKYLKKMLSNVEEYKSYLEFSPLFEAFKKKYQKLLPEGNEKKTKSAKEGTSISNEIKAKEAELDKINRKIDGRGIRLFGPKNAYEVKNLKMKSVNLAKDLYDLYKKSDEEYITERVLTILNKNLTVADLLHLFYSYDYFKKINIKNVFNLKEYEEVVKYSDNFDIFAMDSTNIIVDGVEIFGTSDIPSFIANKYRLNSIRITSEDLSEENLDSIIEKINLIIRDNIIKNSDTNAEKLWFIVQVDKMLAKEKKTSE